MCKEDWKKEKKEPGCRKGGWAFLIGKKDIPNFQFQSYFLWIMRSKTTKKRGKNYI